MSNEVLSQHVKIIANILDKHEFFDDAGFKVKTLFGDGSDRTFYRIINEEEKSLIVVFPSVTHPKAREEARSCYNIGKHLLKADIPVPNIYYFDGDSGAIVYEDLGDIQLFDIANKTDSLDDLLPSEHGGELKKIYFSVIDSLILMQVEGRKGFSKKDCWETENYSKKLMLDRESGYFMKSFCQDFLGMNNFHREVYDEFGQLADRCESECGDYLMHRDFQSRNIMIKNGKIRFIDFQGARLGPLAYDLASLLNDPYVDLPSSFKKQLFDYYINKLEKYISLDREGFIEGYCHISLQRNLQVLGAFSFLSQVKDKPFFKNYIGTALNDLKSKMDKEPLKTKYPFLANLVKEINLD